MIRAISAVSERPGFFGPLILTYKRYLDDPENVAWGSFTPEDEAGIARAYEISSKYDGPIVEIGVLYGHSTNLIASLKPKDKRLIGVDNFCWNPFFLSADQQHEFALRTTRYIRDHCATEICRQDATKFYAENTQLKPSLIFIDADHSYEGVKKDIQGALDIGASVISGHDYNGDRHSDVCRAVHDFFGESIEVCGTVWIHDTGKKA